MTLAASHIRHHRNAKGMSLRTLAEQLGMSPSQLSKIESGKAKLTVETSLRIAGVLQVPASIFLAEQTPRVTGRRTITRSAKGPEHETLGMSMEVLCSDFKEKHNLFWKTEITARSVDENGGWRQHPGQEFLYVLRGKLELHTRYYDPIILNAGDSILFDADQPHAYVGVDGPVQLLMMNSVLPGVAG